MTAPRDAASEDTVSAFLTAQRAHDWSRVADLLAVDVVRRGPDGASCAGRDDYLRFLREVHTTISGYELDVVRLIWSGDGRVAVAEVRERLVQSNGEPLAVTEAMVFDIDAQARIARLSVYTRIDPDDSLPG